MKSRDTSTKPPRKPYLAPVVRVYGNIRAITRALGNAGASDGGTTTQMKKTR